MNIYATKVATKSLLLTLDKKFLRDINRKAKKLGFSTAQQYLYELARRNIYDKPKSGRHKSGELSYLSKFAEPTRKSGKLIRQLRREGMDI